MPRTRKPRKPYRPSPVQTDPVETTIARAGRLRLADQLYLMSPLRAAFDCLRAGTAGWGAWCAAADGLNVAEQLARTSICSDRLPEFTAAQAALQQLHARVSAGGSWTLYAAEIKALDFAFDLHSIQLQYASQGEVQAAILAVQRNVQQALMGNAPQGAMVCMGQLGRPDAAAATPAATPAQKAIA